MAGKKEQDRLNALRERLYARGEEPEKVTRTKLTDEPVDVPKTWTRPKSTSKTQSAASTPAETSAPVSTPMAPKTKKRSYRMKLIITAVVFFIAAVVVSSIVVLIGSNTISGENITVRINGPFTIGGGETISLQIGITNQNAVGIESATLIVEYPRGTQSAEEDSDRELYIERLPLDRIASGETVNVPLQAQIFGEENEELTIHASVEYRVSGSNATFFKEAEPLRFKVSSSPVVIDIDALKSLSAGTETEIAVTVTSNSQNTLSDILVQAEYPSGFNFLESGPSPTSGQNVWAIASLEPEEQKTIRIKGVFLGSESDEFAMHFSVGVANERDPLSLASVFAVSEYDFTIEQPFVNLDVTVNGTKSSEATIAPNESSRVTVHVKNTLDNPLFDGVVVVKLGGNALSDTNVEAERGFYNSNAKTITWDVSSIPGLARIAPGGQESFSFTVKPSNTVSRTPAITIDAAMRARRVSERNVEEELIGTVNANIRVESAISFASETAYSAGILQGSGPIPPTVGETTTYTLSMRVANGSNDITNAVVTSTLPSYVMWNDTTAGYGTFSYNPSTRVIEWNIGSLEADEVATASFQVSILPSVSQIGKTPTLLGQQLFRANDRFTGTVIRTDSPGLSTELSAEAGYGRDSGYVVE